MSLEVRWGWGLPTGFTHIPDPPGRGIMLDPNEGVPGRFDVYFSATSRVMALGYTVALGGNTFRDSPHPSIEYDRFIPQGVFGMHVASRRFSAHLNFYYYRNPPFESANPVTDLTWATSRSSIGSDQRSSLPITVFRWKRMRLAGQQLLVGRRRVVLATRAITPAVRSPGKGRQQPAQVRPGLGSKSESSRTYSRLSSTITRASLIAVSSTARIPP